MFRLPPACSSQGSHWNVPSSVWIAEKAMPYTLLFLSVSFALAASSSDHVFGGLSGFRPWALNMSAL